MTIKVVYLFRLRVGSGTAPAALSKIRGKIRKRRELCGIPRLSGREGKMIVYTTRNPPSMILRTPNLKQKRNLSAYQR